MLLLVVVRNTILMSPLYKRKRKKLSARGRKTTSANIIYESPVKYTTFVSVGQ